MFKLHPNLPVIFWTKLQKLLLGMGEEIPSNGIVTPFRGVFSPSPWVV